MGENENIHVSRTSCLLCREPPIAGACILDLTYSRLVVPQCHSPCGRCNYSPYPMVWFHQTCYRILEATYEPSEKPSAEDLEKFAAATRPVYRPLDPEHNDVVPTLEGLLSKYSARIVQNCFSQKLLARLPLEILLMISELIAPCWFLTVFGESRRLIEHLRWDSRIQDPEIDLSRGIWMSRLTYRGNSYVARLSHSPLKSTAYSCVSYMKLPRGFHKLVLSTDNIGLRGVQFLGNGSTPTRNGSPWYEILDMQDSQLKIRGLFVRDVRPTGNDSGNGTSSASIKWTSPSSPDFHARNFVSHRQEHRLHYMALDPPVQGLLVCSAAGQTVGIHAFSGTNQAFKKFVDSADRRVKKIRLRDSLVHVVKESCPYWFYFPLNDQEDIQGAWIRNWRQPQGEAKEIFTDALMLRTSLGRSVTFGPVYPDRYTDDCDYIPLVRNTDGPISGIFHDGFDPVKDCIQVCGATCDSPRDDKAPVLLPWRNAIRPPGVNPDDDRYPWFKTNATLRGLTKVQVCRDRTQPHHPCLGMLMFYADGHVESSGQIRWDYGLDEEICGPIMVVKGVVNGKLFVKDIQSAKDEVESTVRSPGRHILPAEGLFVWWFSELGDRLTVCYQP
ncbi:hypothetical protein ASPBRDRAFT_59125 [Aspergillus brasiliensis CBS 101740]|uniref:Uncharacterized protein n=1 Tax=Aspergillus brasiliensis (strain CBS 101740 / IMI 381727 / IBT 21946) TaxID=767769 RepID=A0A1L9U672_ASPBC|nr:hypothetical protein ASPBRDRAFT_59125 [Aspergillus brasiliensis CBS 101740]